MKLHLLLDSRKLMHYAATHSLVNGLTRHLQPLAS